VEIRAGSGVRLGIGDKFLGNFNLKFISRPRLIALLLALMTLVVFLPATRNKFVNYDDTDYVTENPYVKNGLNGTDIHWAFTNFHAGNWHPVTWISHQLDCELFGLSAGPQHFTNIFFHAANVALVFGLWWRLTGRLSASAVVAALFAWHPLHVESVAWIAERKDVLSTFFGLCALLSYVRFARGNAGGNYWLALAFFALGLLAKPMLVTLPFVFLLLDFWPLARLGGGKKSDARLPNQQRRITGLILEKWPFWLLSGCSCVVTIFAQKSGGAVMSLTRVPLRERLENVPVALLTYVRKLFWPSDLCVIYPLHGLSFWPVVGALGGLAAIFLIAWQWRRTHPGFMMGWLWFLGTLIPVLGLVQVGLQSMADRYTYFPAIGFFAGLVFTTADFLSEWRAPKWMAPGLSGAVLIACLCATENQLTFWRDSESLFRRALAVTNNNLIAMIDLGTALDAQNRFDEALGIYRQAEKFDTGEYFQLHNNLGNILRRLGKHGAALAEYQIAIREQPNAATLHNAAANELAILQRYQEALEEFSLAARLDSQMAAPHLGVAEVLLQSGRDADAVKELREAARLDPDNVQVLILGAQVLAASEDGTARDGKTALMLAFRANDLTGHTQPLVFDAMGMACAELGDFTNAQACAQTAVRLGASLHLENLAALQERLDRYQQHQPWRESFRESLTPAPAGN